MPLDKDRQEEADYMAEKLADLLKESRSLSDRRENRAFYLQVAQFVVTGIVATILAAYGTIIQQHQERQDELAKQAQQTLQQEEAQTTKAKVILDFMPALADTQDASKAKIALQAIEKFIDIDFAKNVTVIINTPALKEGLAGIQDNLQAQLQPVSAPAAGGAQKTGWVYLGNYVNSAWAPRYFTGSGQSDLPSPLDLVAGKSTISVKAEIGAANLRSQPPSSGTRLTATSVLAQVHTNEKLKVDDVQPVPGTTFWWAHVTKI